MVADVQAVVFAGGGSRCFWQLAWWHTVQPALGLAPRVMAGSSAGAAMACLIALGRCHDGFEAFKIATAANERNFYWSRLFRRGQSALPHGAMYRDAIVNLCGAGSFGQLQSGPEVRIVVARPPRWMPAPLGAFLGLIAYDLEKRWRNPVHPASGRWLGFVADWFTAQSCDTPNDLADLVLQSSCVPPFVPVMRREGKFALDGGLVENAPLVAVEDVEGAKLVLLSKPYAEDRMPQREDVTYVQPSEKIRVNKFDYTSPEKLQLAYDLGRSDGEEWLRRAGH